MNAWSRIFSQRAARAANGPLSQLSFAIKDNIAVRGEPLTAGSKILENYISPFTAEAVDSLEQAGARLVGSTHMDEFGMGSHTAFSALAPGPTQLAPDHPYSVGGSSGGAAVVVSTGQVDFALGSDTGGSVRLPAARCGCWGLRPSRGAISRSGLVAYASSLDTIGILSSEVDVLERVFGELAGAREHHVGDMVRPEAPWQDALPPAEPVAVAIPRQVYCQELSEGSRRTILAAADAVGLEHVHEVDMPSLEVALAAYYVIACAEASSNLSRFDGMRYGARVPPPANATPEELTFAATIHRNRTALLGRRVRERILIGCVASSRDTSAVDLQAAVAVRDALRAEYARAFRGARVVMEPVSAAAEAPALERVLSEEYTLLDEAMEDVYTVGAALAGLPALAVPTAAGPIQLTAPPGGEADLMAVGRSLVAALGQQERLYTVQPPPQPTPDQGQ